MDEKSARDQAVAVGTIDMAIWDALGKVLGLPVGDMFGGYTDRMRVSHMLGFAEPAAMVAEAEKMVDTYGIRTFKVKVGRRPAQLDTTVDQLDNEYEDVTRSLNLAKAEADSIGKTAPAKAKEAPA